jgi:transposase
MSKTPTPTTEPHTPVPRRRWTRQEKRRIVKATLEAGASLAQVALAHAVNANQVHSWRRLYERGLLNDEAERATLLPMRVVPDAPDSLPVVRLSSPSAATATAQKARRLRPSGVIQVEAERGRLRIEGAADPMTLRVVLESLLG